jgi:hypothetical protein
MFEVIISSVSTGRVRRKIFDTHQEADAHIDRFLDGRSRRDYRVEVQYRPEPAPFTQARSASEGAVSASAALISAA